MLASLQSFSVFLQSLFMSIIDIHTRLRIWSPPLMSQVMLVGDSGVGKTCLLVRFKDGAFLAGSFISTVGIDFRVSNEASSGDWG